MKNRLKSTFNLQDNQISVEEESGTYTVTMTIDNKEKTYTFNVATGQTSKPKTIAEYPAATPGTPTTENSKYTSNNKTAVIPAGYTVDATQNSIDNGLVISKDGNEWVWIPVANVTDLYIENTTETPWTMYETSGENAVVSRYASKSEILSGQTRTTPGDTSAYREPDTLGALPSYMGGGETDKLEANWTAAGFSSFNDMAIKLKDDYKNMLDSVRKNGGFYIGRYELSSAGTKKDQPSLTNTNWYNLYAKCKTLGDESTTYSRMIWGCQWDQVCKFISTAKDKNGQTISLSDSTSYGNYWNSENSPHNKINTGSNDNCKTNNIYDLAGNCWEWTQEARSTHGRAGRGGVYDINGDDGPVTYRDSSLPTSTSDSTSSRPTLYIK